MPQNTENVNFRLSKSISLLFPQPLSLSICYKRMTKDNTGKCVGRQTCQCNGDGVWKQVQSSWKITWNYN